MSEKLIIEDTPQPEEVEMEGEVIYSSSHDYITSATQAMAVIVELDTGLMNKTDEKRVNRIKRQSLRLLSFYINEIYGKHKR